MPWRQALRLGLVETHGRRRSLCRDAGGALRPCLPPARLFATLDAHARHQPLPPAAAKGRSTRAVLISCRGRAEEPAIRAEASGVAREKRLEARDVEAIFRAFAEVLRELPPDTEAGFLDAEGDLRLAPDIGRKLRTARNVREVLRQIRESEAER